MKKNSFKTLLLWTTISIFTVSKSAYAQYPGHSEFPKKFSEINSVLTDGSGYYSTGYRTSENKVVKVQDYVIRRKGYNTGFINSQYLTSSNLLNISSSGEIIFGENNTDSFTNLTIYGKVGIGTNPTEKLEVDGTIKAHSFKFSDGTTISSRSQWTASDTTINYASGNVGIDNASPTAKLEIGTNNTSSLPTITPNQELLKVHGSATFDDNNDNALTQVSINTEYKLEHSALTVGGPTFIGSWDETKNIANAPTVKADYLTKYNLWVTKGVVSEDFAITSKDSWKDEVFKEGYKLPTLSEVETFVKQNKHLPGVPSEKEVMEKGYTVHQMNNAFIEKIEHLVLYSIEQEKKLKEQAKQLQEQNVLNEEFKAKLDILQAKLETISNKK